MSKTEESINRQALEDNIHAIIKKQQGYSRSGGGTLYSSSELFAVMRELHNATVKNTLRYAADKAKAINNGKDYLVSSVQIEVDEKSILDLEKDLLI